jgi:hypothetical protein
MSVGRHVVENTGKVIDIELPFPGLADGQIDGYDLPDSLQQWLFPSDGSSRDFPTLQVVFGRGEEFFASDKDGKVEWKEPEVKKADAVPVDAGSEKTEKPGLKRSRTISFARRSTEFSSSSRPNSLEMAGTSDAATRSHSSSINSQSAPRSQRISLIGRTASDPTTQTLESGSESPINEAPSTAAPVLSSRRKSRPLSMTFSMSAFPRIVEGKPLSPSSIASDWTQATKDTEFCTCGYHGLPVAKPSYADAAVQTDPEPAPEPASLVAAEAFHAYDHDSYNADTDDGFHGATPAFAGRMMDYYNNPGYRLGDGLMSMYAYHYDPVEEVP